MTDFAQLETTELVKLLAEIDIARAGLVTELRSRDDLEAAYVEVIPQMAGNANFFLRGMRMLVDFQCVEAIDVLVPFTDDENETIRQYATQAFEELRAIYATVTEDDIETRVSWLVKGLDERENKVNELVRVALLEIGKAAVPALLNSFSYTNRKEQVGVLYVLVDIDYYDDTVFETIKSLLYGDDYNLIYAAMRALEKLTPGHIYRKFYKDYVLTLKPIHDELKDARQAKREADAAKQKERAIAGWVRQLSAPDGRSRVDAMRELAFMNASDRKVAARLIADFDDAKGYGYKVEKDHAIQYMNWDVDAIFAGMKEPQISAEKKKHIEFLMSNLQQSKDGIARAEAANDLVKMGNVAVYTLVKALQETPRPHDVATTLERINPIYGRRAKEWIQQNKR